MNCFYYESKFKIKKNIFFCFGGGGWGGVGVGKGGAIVSDFFFCFEYIYPLIH